MRASMIVAVCAALGLGVLWGVLIVSLCQAAKRGDEHLDAFRTLAPDELEDWSAN